MKLLIIIIRLNIICVTCTITTKSDSYIYMVWIDIFVWLTGRGIYTCPIIDIKLEWLDIFYPHGVSFQNIRLVLIEYDILVDRVAFSNGIGRQGFQIENRMAVDSSCCTYYVQHQVTNKSIVHFTCFFIVSNMDLPDSNRRTAATHHIVAQEVKESKRSIEQHDAVGWCKN